MNLFFKPQKEYLNTKVIFDDKFFVGDRIKVNYYDQYKYLHTLEGKCVKKRKVADTYYVVVYEKNKNFYFSFFLNAPLILSVFKY
jgi:hypothetical protein